MIIEYKKNDVPKILEVINDASLKYKGVIPDDCWQEPYMSEKELINEFIDGVHMFGYQNNDKLIGVIGIQKVKDVILIRHAYTLTSYQGQGTGSLLLENLLKKNHKILFCLMESLIRQKKCLILLLDILIWILKNLFLTKKNY